MKALEARATTAITLKNILFATDFSAASERALRYAMAICRRYGSTLNAVHVMQEVSSLEQSVNPVTLESIYEEVRRDAQEQMNRLAACFQGIPNRTYVRHGYVSDVLSEIIRASDIDLLVLGTHGRTGVGKLLMGSIAEEMFRQAPCPVLTVGPKVGVRSEFSMLKGESENSQEIELRRIVYATDFTSHSLAAAPLAISMAQEFQAHLTLLHVIDKGVGDLQHRPGPIEGVLRRLEKLVPEEAALWCSPEPTVEFGSPADCILETASERNADLIVLGVRSGNGHLGTATHLPWATAHKIIARASCPVLTVRG